MKTLKEKQESEYRRWQVVESALRAADGIILEGSDGSNEETNFLTARVAERMIEKALHPFYRGMLCRDMKD